MYTHASMTTEPLAYRMRPRTLAEFIGQEHVVGSGSALRAAIERDALSSVILSGPPGTGKTTLAKVIAEATKAAFVQVNAVLSGVKELKEACLEAGRRREAFTQRTVLFIDEIHRFNKAQQDALLPFVEDGTVILIGATTENPYFEVNPALVSRSHVYLLRPLSAEHLTVILERAIADERGYGGGVTVAPDALRSIAQKANGDARVALNLLELTILAAGGTAGIADVERILQERRKRYDHGGEDHYNVISAFIKTLRGSDPDAALVWMFHMIECGEEPRFLFRRMAILASEDIGMADPHALGFVMDAWRAFELVGLPEGEYFLAHACVYLALAPKSNAVARAMSAARQALKAAGTVEVPMHLRNAPVKAMRAQGYGDGYRYPHEDPRGVVSAQYFPMGMEPCNFFVPSEHGNEKVLQERLLHLRALLRTGSENRPMGRG